ncbi:cadherin-like domain-containing protein [Aquabacter sp. CN5-332]|uniref:cadherin-like domain-containing protein n=1 Tax=Aquabacter sp. CN5-332 TaxID=3156608 RepID=UPI0032B39FDC
MPAASLTLALEPRFMYDAAGGATAAAVAKAAEAPPAPPPADHAAESAAKDQANPAAVDKPSNTTPGDGAKHTEVPADVGPFGSKGEAQLEKAAAQGATPITEIVFVDGRLPDLGALKAQPGVEIVVLDPAKDGLAQVSDALAAHKGDLKAIHFVGHGENGEFGIGTTTVDATTLSAKAGQIAEWGSALTQNGDIMIWGCDVAQLPGGQAFINSLSSLTGADVAASTDATGAATRGGDWDLEAKTGSIETVVPFEMAAAAAWDHLLDTPTVTGTADVLRVAEPSVLNDPGADTGSLSGWQFTSSNTGDQFTVRATIGDTTVGTLLNGSGQGSAIAGGWTFTGTLAQANAWLDQISFKAADVERGATSGATTLTLQITNQTDGAHPTSQRSIAVEVTPSNDPVLVSDSIMTVQEGSTGTAVPVSALPAADPEVTAGSQNPSQIVYRLNANPIYGYLTLNGTRIGVGSVFTQQNVIDGNLVYVHTATGATQNTDDTFSILVNDGATPIAQSDSATVTVDITPVNQAPSISGGGAVYEGQPANATDGGVPQSVVGNFITADGGGDPTDTDSALNVRITSLAEHGTLYFTGTAIVNGVTQNFVNHQITQSEISTGSGFRFAYNARGGLTYANDGVDNTGGGDPNPQRPEDDSFGVEVTDGGGGTSPSAPLSATSTIDITVRAVNDEPVWVESSTLAASIDSSFMVQLNTAMLNVTDVDSNPENLTFRVTSQAGLDQGRLVFKDGGTEYFIPNGGTFTLADVLAGRVYYYQMAAATLGDTDTFNFQVLDNAISPHWEANGNQFERLGGVYTGQAPADTLRNFQFTINLQPTPTGTGLGGGLPDLGTVASHNSSDYAGTNTAGVAQGTLPEGGTVVLTDGSGSNPGLSYEVDGVAPEQVVYTVLAFNGGDFGAWNGQLQKFVNGSWVTLGVYDTFTQADLNNSNVRFVHDGGEDFESSVTLSASAGVLVDSGGGVLAPDAWVTDFTFYVQPVNDTPTAAGSSVNVVNEGATFYITTAQLSFADPDDANSESYLEGSATLPGGGDNFAYNNGSQLTFKITDLPDNGALQYWDGDSWEVVIGSTVLEASWITGDAGTTRLRYVHNGGETRLDTFQAQATDRWSATSTTASVGFVVTPLNDPPQIASDPTQADPTGVIPATGSGGSAANQPLEIVYEGSFERITSAMLQAVDPDSTNMQVQYRITGAPAHGRIAYSTDGGLTFTTISVGSSFSQADVDAGRIYYLHNGDDPTSTGYPATPDDKFTFTLSDGAAEQTAREFWIYVKPSNDQPVVTAPSGPIDSTNNQTDIPGFSVSDPDLAVVNPTYETDYIQVTVRLLHENGTAFTAGEYADVTIDVDTAITQDGDKNGINDYLVLRGTRDEINAALATLSVAFSTDHDQTYQVQVIADDRLRNADGSFKDVDTGTGGTQYGGNGGGTVNQPSVVLTGQATPVINTELDWYSAVVPTLALPTSDPLYHLAGNMNAAAVTIRASTVNDPAGLTGNGTATVYEDQATPIGSTINFNISDAESDSFGTPVTVTLSVPNGTLNAGTQAGITVSGRNTGTLTVTGIASDIEAFLNSSLTYKSAADVNHDLNGADAGDVTLTVSFSDTGSNIGSSGASANPPNLEIGLTIVPVNDRPTVSGGGDTVPLTGPTDVDGFQVADKDISGDGGNVADGESDFLEVTIRLTDDAGNPLDLASYNGTNGIINITSTASVPGLVVDSTYDGTGSALVLRGTRDQINSYLDGLRVEIGGGLTNTDAHYHVEVIADDRERDSGTGALVGTEANGGENDNAGNGTADVPTAEFDIYSDTTTEILALGLTPNVNFANRDVFPTSVNDPAHVDVPAQQQNEGGSTYQFHDIAITDSDALSDDLTITVTLEAGFNIVEADGAAVGPVGTLQFTGSLSEINAWVNSLKVQLPNTDGARTDWNGDFGVTIVVNDNGNNGGRPGSLTGDTDNPDANPGDFAYADGSSNILVTTREFSVTINAVNDAPVVDNSGGTAEHLPAINEDTAAASITGDTVSNLFSGYFTDGTDQITDGSAQDAFVGVVVTGLTTNANQGVWQYSTDGGTSWTAIGPRTDATGLYLQADALVRFVPADDFHGTPEQLTVRLVENNVGGGNDPMSGSTTSPTNGGNVDVSGANNGGTTRYSAGTVTLDIHVDNVNDQPTVNNGTLPSVVEDTANPAGQTVTQLFGGSYSDATDNQSAAPIGGENAAGALGGITIVGNNASAAEGTWQYFDGGVWNDIPTSGLDESNALQLTTSTLIRFLPAANFNGTPGALEVRVTDQAVASNGYADISGAVDDTATSTSHWSTERTLSTIVTPVNDAPVIGGTTLDGVTPSVTENASVGTGTTSVNLISSGSLSDVDLTTTPGLSAGVFGAGQIEITLDAYVTGDRLEVTGLPAGVTIDGTENGVGRSLIIHLDDNTTVAEVQAILNAITFRNTTDNPTNYGSNDTRTYHVQVRDGVNTDPDGDTAGTGGSLASNILTGTILIAPVNDPPVAENNVNTVAEDGAPVGGNVITDGTPLDSDPDNTVPQLFLTQVSNGVDPAVTPTGGVMVVEGKHGTLTINEDGTYTYTLNPDDPIVNALKTGETLNDEVFTYTLSDPDGGTDTATLTIDITGHTDNTPAIAAVDGNAGATGENTVSEAGLPTGTDPSATSETVNGTITVDAADGLANIIISDGVDDTVTLDVTDLAGLSPSTPVTIVTAKGTLVLNGFTPGTDIGGVPTSGTLSYTYTLTSGQDHSGSPVTDVFNLTVTDAGGDTDTGNLTILIQNDAPIARADTNEITEDTSSTVGGNVFGATGASSTDVADTIGADGAHAPGPVTGVSFGATVGTVGASLTTAYGSIVLNADGSYTYTLNNGNATVNALQTGDTLTEVVTYTITDADGDTSQTTLTITIHGNSDGTGPSITPADENGSGVTGQNTVNESGLPGGTLEAGNGETTDGTIDVSAPDGLVSVTVGGTEILLADIENLGTTPVVITTPDGTITLTGFDVISEVGGVPTHGTITYTYTLADNQDHTSGTVTDNIALQVDDAGGGSASGTLTILVQNDAPIARNDTAAITEGGVGTVDGNVFGGAGAGPGDVADTIGADGPSVPGAVTDVAFGSTPGTVGASLTLAYGSIVLNADGTYTYTLDNTNAAVNALKDGDTLTEVVTYTIKDADGDISTATLTITIGGDTDGTPTIAPDDMNGSVGGENTVHESGLTDTSGDQITTGMIQITAPDGVKSITVGGVEVPLSDLDDLGTTPVVITTPAGTITLTGFTPGTTVGGVPTSGELTYTYELINPQHQPGATQSTDPIPLIVTDAGGDTATGTLTITIIDHVPHAVNDTASITENASPATVSGNVITPNDTSGADGYPTTGGLTGLVFEGNPKTVGTSFQTSFGSIVINADGSYIYTLDNTNPIVTALRDGDTLTEKVTYTITDADGDTSTATLTITINGANDAPVTPGDFVSGREDTPIVFTPADFTSTDAEGDTPTAIRITDLPPLGALYLDGILVTPGTEVSIADIAAGKLTYQPAPDGNGPNYTNFTFQVSDGLTFSNPGNMRIDIVPENDQPEATGSVTLPPVDNSPGEKPGNTFGDLLTGNYNDHKDDVSVSHGTDGDTPLTGVAISGNGATPDQGAWQYNLNDGNGWQQIPSGGLSEGNALVLPSTAQVRFVPATGFSGTPGQLSVHLSDGFAFPGVGFADLTAVAAGAPGTHTGGWSRSAVPISIGVVNVPGSNEAADIDTRGYDKWGVMTGFRPYAVAPLAEGGFPYLEGWPIHRYTTTWQGISQQVMFRFSGDTNQSNLFFEATLGRNQALPSWVSFDPYTQTVMALPPDDVEPGVYMIRVVARDSTGHEAESTVTIHVLRDNNKSLDTAKVRIQPPEITPPADEPEQQQQDEPKQQENAPAAPDAAPANQEEQKSTDNQNSDRESVEYKTANLTSLQEIAVDSSLLGGAGKMYFGNAGGDKLPEAQKMSGGSASDLHINPSLTKTLLNSGPTGRMIEAAQLLEALAADMRPHL